MLFVYDITYFLYLMTSIYFVFWFSAEKSLRNTLAGFENAYLSRSLSRLFDPINLVFASNVGSLPSTEEMENIGKTLSR